MQIQHAMRLVREVCALRHLSINTEKTYTHWLRHYGLWLRDPKLKSLATEQKLEAFLTQLAHSGVSAATQNQAFNAGAFVRDLQVVLGHSHLETTMLYLHAEAGRVVSPLSGYTAGASPETTEPAHHAEQATDCDALPGMGTGFR
jgi:site-specific recombinase XerD